MSSEPVMPPSESAIDAELMAAVYGYDPNDRYPEWSNSSMREAYLAGWEDGRLGYGEQDVNATSTPCIPYHLRVDAPPLAECDRCHRKSWSESEIDRIDQMRQPDGLPCGGWFVGYANPMDRGLERE